MKSRLAQLRSDLTIASVLLVGSLALIAFAFVAPRLPSPPSPHHDQKILSNYP